MFTVNCCLGKSYLKLLQVADDSELYFLELRFLRVQFIQRSLKN